MSANDNTVSTSSYPVLGRQEIVTIKDSGKRVQDNEREELNIQVEAHTKVQALEEVSQKLQKYQASEAEAMKSAKRAEETGLFSELSSSKGQQQSQEIVQKKMNMIATAEAYASMKSVSVDLKSLSDEYQADYTACLSLEKESQNGSFSGNLQSRWNGKAKRVQILHQKLTVSIEAHVNRFASLDKKYEGILRGQIKASNTPGADKLIVSFQQIIFKECTKVFKMACEANTQFLSTCMKSVEACQEFALHLISKLEHNKTTTQEQEINFAGRSGAQVYGNEHGVIGVGDLSAYDRANQLNKVLLGNAQKNPFTLSACELEEKNDC